MKDKIGDYLLDISKLVFAGVVLSTVLELDVSKPLVLFVDVYASFMIAIMGFLFLWRK